MNVTIDKKDALNATISVNISSADYQPEIEKKIKDYQKKANVPGFRPGMVPKGMIEKMFGNSILLESINSIASKGLFDFIDAEKINMLGQPVMSEDSKVDELSKNADYTFKFDIGLAPQFELAISNEDVFTKYKVVISEKEIDDEVERIQRKAGKLTIVDTAGEDDIVYGNFVELGDNGEPIEGGVSTDNVPVLIQSIKHEESKKQFLGLNTGTTIQVNVFDLFDQNESEISHALNIDKLTVGDISKTFKVEVKEIKRNEKAELNQELFDSYYGEGVITSVEQLREKIKGELSVYFESQTDHLFEHEMLDTLVSKHNIQLPDAFLKRWLIDRYSDKFNNDNIDENYEKEASYLKNHLFEEKVLSEAGTKVEEADIKQAAINYTKSMFGAYGGSALNDEMLERIIEPSMQKEDYRSRMINLAVSQKVRDVLKSKITISEQDINTEDFYKLVTKHNQDHKH
ncbi:MAG: trigger factor [Bacteroidia bacterium]|jgi:trigger factor|nr:trigger factor [Bacteroidia bacterium]